MSSTSGTPRGTIRSTLGRSSLSTGLAESDPCRTSQMQKLDTTDWRTRMVPSARSFMAMWAIQARIVAGVRSSTAGGRPVSARTNFRNCSSVHQ